jgi:hypothetical protein
VHRYEEQKAVCHSMERQCTRDAPDDPAYLDSSAPLDWPQARLGGVVSAQRSMPFELQWKSRAPPCRTIHVA